MAVRTIEVRERVMARNDQIGDYSLVQYAGTDVDGGFSYNGAPLGYYEYARAAISGGRTDFNPVFELTTTMAALCNDLEDRRQAVDQAVANGIAARLHPSAIPADIYSSDDGVWESYATPARDTRLRAGFVQFHRDLAAMIGQWLQRDPRIVYDGQFLQRDLMAAYQRQSRACAITFLASDKTPVTLSFDDIAHRLFALSFDPYNCVELRWGGDSAACPDQSGKRRYYAAEDAARHLIDRDTGETAGPGDVDIQDLIAAMPARAPWIQSFPGAEAKR